MQPLEGAIAVAKFGPMLTGKNSKLNVVRCSILAHIISVYTESLRRVCRSIAGAYHVSSFEPQLGACTQKET